MRPLLRPAVIASALIVGGCHQPPRLAAAPAMPATPREDYCWWTVSHTTQPADTVAVRFARAFANAGIAGGTWGHLADTAWAHAGPTRLAGDRGDATYTARVVAYRHGDSTSFRTYVGLARSPADSASEGGRRIGLCGDLTRLAHAGGIAAPAPTREEQLSVWRDRP